MSAVELSDPSGWTLVVAVASNGVIGRGDALPWRLSSDLQRFKKMTMGHCLLMGRTTFESIGKALPGRQTIVLTRRGFEAPAGVSFASSLEEVSALVEPNRKIMVVGGAQVYQSALARCSAAWVTRVLADVDGDVHFPPLPPEQWQLASAESFPAGPKDEHPTVLEIWHRIA